MRRRRDLENEALAKSMREGSRAIAREKGWDMYANDLGDQIDGMETVLSELELPPAERKSNRGGQSSK